MSVRAQLLVAGLCFAVAALVASRQVRPPAPPPPLPVIPIAVTVPLTPEESMQSALEGRRWDEAERLERDPALAAHPRLAAWREHRRRGEQRDLKGIIESKLLHGNLGALGLLETQRQSLKQLDPAAAPYTLPEKRLKDLLVFAPRKLDSEAVAPLLEELRILNIAGLEVNPAGKPLPELAGARLRYLGGAAIDRLPPAVFSGCPEPEIVDLTSRKEAFVEVLAALARRPSLRILRLPAAQPLGPAAQRSLATLSGLEELTCSASGLDAAAVGRLTVLARLRTLRLDNQLAVDGFAGLGRLSALRRLTCTLAAGADLSPLAAMQDLDELTLAVAAVGSPDPGWLRFVRAKVVRLSQAGVDDRYAEVVARMPLLDRVELSSTAISDAGLLTLAKHPSLRALDVGANPGITGAVLPRLLRPSALRELRLACPGIPEAALLACPGPGQIERFTWGAATIDKTLIEHLIAWPGMVRVTVAAKLDPEVKKRLDAANERRSEVPPDLPSAPIFGF